MARATTPCGKNESKRECMCEDMTRACSVCLPSTLRHPYFNLSSFALARVFAVMFIGGARSNSALALGKVARSQFQKYKLDTNRSTGRRSTTYLFQKRD